ncbi:hypothetical protein TNCV_3256161 [Trichonephila clavipes]|nr:hypothetical protein TNCV_3256161 [Trichonephila clavipes]
MSLSSNASKDLSAVKLMQIKIVVGQSHWLESTEKGCQLRTQFLAKIIKEIRKEKKTVTYDVYALANDYTPFFGGKFNLPYSSADHNQVRDYGYRKRSTWPKNYATKDSF